MKSLQMAKLATPLAMVLLILAASPAPATDWSQHTVKAGSGPDYDSADGVRLYDFDGDGDQDVISAFESSNSVVIFENHRPADTDEWNELVNITFAGECSPEDAFLSDLDANGTLDVVTSCNYGGHVYLTVLNQPLETYSFKDAGVLPRPNRNWLYAIPVDLDEDGDTDIVVGAAGDDPALGWLENPGGTIDGEQISKWRYAHIGDVKQPMSIIASNMDDDKHLDILVSDRRKLKWFRNVIHAGRRAKWPLGDTILRGIGKTMFTHEADVDYDGDKDIVVAIKEGGSLGSGVVYVERLKDNSGRSWNTTHIPLPTGATWGGLPKAARAGNITNGSHLDIVVSFVQAEGDHGVSILSYNGTDWRWGAISGATSGSGIKFDDIRILDLNGDKAPDVLTTEEMEGPGGVGLGVVWYQHPGHK